MVEIILNVLDFEAFAKVAKKNLIEDFILLYDSTFFEKNKDKILNLSKKNYKNINFKIGIIVKNQNESSKYKKYLIFAKGEHWAFESKNVNFVFDMEILYQKDAMHYRLSGMNQSFARMAKKKKKVICFNFSNLFGKYPEQILGKMMQNAGLVNRYNLGFVCASFGKSHLDIFNDNMYKSFAKVVGIEDKRIKNSYKF
jgi:hypothetical protein